MKRLFFTVTNDLAYDQRMQRICRSLADAGYAVTLVGRLLPNSPSLPLTSFRQKRLRCFFTKGPFFYAEYNLRLFFFLFSQRIDAICAIDLDTILPCLAISVLKRIPRVYDAHEYFTELKEVRTRPRIQRIWLAVERFAVPRFRLGYTVSQGLAETFALHYGRSYEVIRNLPVLKPVTEEKAAEAFLFFGGTVNEARGFEALIPAMVSIPAQLVIAGDGNFMQQLKILIEQYGVAAKITLLGMVSPEELRRLSEQAAIGIGLAEKEGANQFLALPNKFFDYVHARLPQVTMNYPEYARINETYPVAVLLNNLEPTEIAEQISILLQDAGKRKAMEITCDKAREVFHWGIEENKLIAFYHQIFAVASAQ